MVKLILIFFSEQFKDLKVGFNYVFWRRKNVREQIFSFNDFQVDLTVYFYCV
ncbi:MAG: hypothetical protein AB1403_01650 [Candidatus Riflebacteria bacterium]